MMKKTTHWVVVAFVMLVVLGASGPAYARDLPKRGGGNPTTTTAAPTTTTTKVAPATVVVTTTTAKPVASPSTTTKAPAKVVPPTTLATTTTTVPALPSPWPVVDGQVTPIGTESLIAQLRNLGVNGIEPADWGAFPVEWINVRLAGSPEMATQPEPLFASVFASALRGKSAQAAGVLGLDTVWNSTSGLTPAGVKLAADTALEARQQFTGSVGSLPSGRYQLIMANGEKSPYANEVDAKQVNAAGVGPFAGFRTIDQKACVKQVWVDRLGNIYEACGKCTPKVSTPKATRPVATKPTRRPVVTRKPRMTTPPPATKPGRRTTVTVPEAITPPMTVPPTVGSSTPPTAPPTTKPCPSGTVRKGSACESPPAQPTTPPATQPTVPVATIAPAVTRAPDPVPSGPVVTVDPPRVTVPSNSGDKPTGITLPPTSAPLPTAPVTRVTTPGTVKSD